MGIFFHFYSCLITYFLKECGCLQEEDIWRLELQQKEKGQKSTLSLKMRQ